MKIVEKLRLRYKQFEKHPLTRENISYSILLYFWFNIYGHFKSQIAFTWINGLKLLIRKGDAGLVANIYFGLCEFQESAFLLHFLRKEDVFVDIGANLGHYSLLASGIADCNSIAVEPVPAVFEQLQKQIILNDLKQKVTTLNIGISDQPGALYFSTDRGTMNRVVSEKYPASVQVPVKTLDQTLAGKNINLMKIDVEGFEEKVLRGGNDTLRNLSLKAVILELNSNNNYYGATNAMVLNYMTEKGFRPYEYIPFHRKLLPLPSYNKSQFNTIFVRDLDFVRSRIISGKKINIRGHQV